MVTDWFITVGLGMVEWLMSLLPTAAPPAWVAQVGTLVNQLFASISGLGVWVPWLLVFGVSSFVFALWLTGLTIRAVRWVASILPLIGGG